MSATFSEPINQIAWLVEDLDTSMHRWMTHVGVGPWTRYRNVTLRGEGGGRASSVLFDVGLSYQAGVQIELIQVRSEGPSPYRGADGAVLLGMHHVAWLSKDLDTDVERAEARGLTTIFRAATPATRVAYLTPPGELSVVLELIEATPAVLDGFREGQAACERWDGVPLIREIDLAALSAGG
jgi:methylmalonyl-CoA/ethylmalonyl-CoA epimerase